jgi:quercetin dioxygenase-like cupin family protein
MKTTSFLVALLLSSFLALAASADKTDKTDKAATPAAAAAGMHGAAGMPHTVASSSVTWSDAGGMPKGVQSSLVWGNPAKGPYLVMLKIPAGTVIMPHTHTAEEVTTVLSGTLLFGSGEKVDEAKATELTAGGYLDVPPKAPHWARAKTEVVTVRFANGAGDVMYVDPKDDPRKK